MNHRGTETQRKPRKLGHGISRKKHGKEFCQNTLPCLFRVIPWLFFLLTFSVLSVSSVAQNDRRFTSPGSRPCPNRGRRPRRGRTTRRGIRFGCGPSLPCWQSGR